MPFSTVFQLCRSRKCTYPCFPGVLLTSTPHSIPSKPLAALVLHNHCGNSSRGLYAIDRAMGLCCTDGQTDRQLDLIIPSLLFSEIQIQLKSWIYFPAYLQPFPKRGILDSSKLKEFADDNFKFIENGRKLSKQVENTV